jgi:hypothetical protein
MESAIFDLLLQANKKKVKHFTALLSRPINRMGPQGSLDHSDLGAEILSFVAREKRTIFTRNSCDCTAWDALVCAILPFYYLGIFT